MLVGRSFACARIDELLTDAARGGSGALVLRGPLGVGKSALLAWAAETARAGADVQILSTTGAEPEADLAFSSLHEVLHPILGLIDQIPDVQARALEGALALADAQGAGRMYIGAAALSLLSAAAAEHPVLCLIDDAGLLDPASADAFRFAARRLGAEGIAMIFAADDGGFDATGLEEVVVEDLDLTDAASLLRTVAPTMADDLVASLVRSTGGNPLALTEIPQLLTEAQLAGDEPLPHPIPVGDRIVATIVGRTEGMSADAKRALLIASASSTDAMRVISAPADDLPGELEEAEILGIVSLDAGRLRFAHPLVRSAIYRSATPADRRAAHRHLAQRLADEPRYRERRAWHLAAAATGPDDDVAQEVEDIAVTVELRRAHVNAAALFERSARLSTDDGLRARRLVEAAWSARLAGHADRAESFATQALDAARDPVVRARALIVDGLLAIASGRPIDTATLIEAADDVRGAAPDLAARLLASVSEVGSGDDAVEVAQRAAVIAPAGSDAQVYAAVAQARALVRAGRPDEALAHVNEATSYLQADRALAEDPEILMAVVDGLADVEGDAATSEELLRVASEAAREHTLVVLPRALLHRSYLEHERGAWRDAYVHAFEATRLFDETGQHRSALPARAWLGQVEAWFGHEDAANGIAGDVLASRGFERASLELASARIEGVLALTCGLPDQAAERLHRWVEGSKVWPALLPTSSLDVVDAVEALAHSGAVGVATSLRSSVVGARPIDRVCRAWIDGLLGEGSPAAAFERASSEAAALDPGRPFVRARIALATGERLRREGHRADARAALGSAIEGFETVDSERWADRARRELRATGARMQRRRASGLDELTPQELQVARVIAGGATYKEAAARLFLAPKTIEYHLGKIYRKLEIRSRGELAALYAGEEGP